MRTDDDQVARRLGLMLAALLLTLVMALASCGPGVVGTGDGNAPVPAAAVADAPVCAEAFGALLSCPTGTGSNVSVGTGRVTWSDADDQDADANVGARFTSNNLELEQPCAGLRFDGRFTLLDDGQRAFAGSWVDGASAVPRTGFVFVTLDAAGAARLNLQLVDVDGVLRHGPWVLRATASSPAFAACDRAT